MGEARGVLGEKSVENLSMFSSVSWVLVVVVMVCGRCCCGADAMNWYM
jgi:hypothetical protein